jgi:hypothetical protein
LQSGKASGKRSIEPCFSDRALRQPRQSSTSRGADRILQQRIRIVFIIGKPFVFYCIRPQSWHVYFLWLDFELADFESQPSSRIDVCRLRLDCMQAIRQQRMARHRPRSAYS